MRSSVCVASSCAARAFASSVEIPTLRAPSLATWRAFREASPESPVLVKDSLRHWQLRRWTPAKLRVLDIQVPLEMSKGGGDYRDVFRLDDTDQAGVTHVARESGTRAFVAGHVVSLRSFCDTFLMPGSKTYDTSAYLAQYDLVSAVPELARDCGPPPPFLENKKHTRNTWLGPGGTVTPLHRDPSHNFFCQAWGTKRLLLYPRRETRDTMRAFPNTNGFLRNTSMVDPECAHSLAQNPAFFEMAKQRGLRVDLTPGDALFLPKGTWHHARSTSPSLSMSYWWEEREGDESRAMTPRSFTGVTDANK